VQWIVQQQQEHQHQHASERCEGRGERGEGRGGGEGREGRKREGEDLAKITQRTHGGNFFKCARVIAMYLFIDVCFSNQWKKWCMHLGVVSCAGCACGVWGVGCGVGRACACRVSVGGVGM
jgi:hypothetical protein